MTPVTRVEIRKALVGFWNEMELGGKFPEIFIFGSLINRNGRHFIPAGAMGSDIDLLVVFNPESSDAVARWNALKDLKSVMQELEIRLASILGRKDKILSVLPVTDYEVYHSIHKGHDPKIFTLNIFYDALLDKEEEEGLSDFIDFDFHLENIEQFSVIKTSQSFRNRYLWVDLIGTPQLANFDGPGEVAKELMRAFALLNYVDSGKAKDGYRTDLELGFRVLKRVLQEKSKDCEPIGELYEKVEARSFERATSEPLTPDDQLLLFEIAFDEAKSKIRKSVREVIDGM